MIFLRKLHKWLALIIGAQLIVWLVTGTVISFIDKAQVSGAVTLNTVGDKLLPSFSASLLPLADIALAEHPTRSVALKSFLDRPVYRVEQGDSIELFDARGGQRIVIDQALAQQVALASYRGNGQLVSTERLASGSNEVRDATGPVWRVQTDDSLATRIYISESDGQVLAHRNTRWKVVDFLLMLHFMDYFRADHFNNAQIIVIGFGTLWIAISGMLLVITSFSRADFLWLPFVGTRGRKVWSTVRSDVRGGESLALDSALSYYAGLAQRGISLPSNCDGSGSCGLCKVHYATSAPDPTAVDNEWLNATDLAAGVRLGCQHKPQTDDEVIVPEFAFQQTTQSAEVIASRWLTPLLKEITIRPDEPLDFSPGDFVEFKIPAYQTSREQLDIPAPFRDVWDQLLIPASWSHEGASDIARTYSIATPPSADDPQELVFTVRFSPPPLGATCLPGVGSSFMCGLRAGERIALRGPAGDFRLVDSDQEKIFIGGGAGMAPLKSMALHLLNGGGWQGKLRFWYGARNQSEILYRDIFQTLAQAHANFQWQVALSDADDDADWVGARGHVHEAVYEAVLKDHASLSECEFYLCGPPLMLAATRRMLGELGVPDSTVRFDDFGN